MVGVTFDFRNDMKIGKIIEELEKLGYNISDQDTDDRVWIDGIIIETMRMVTEDLVSKNESLHLVSESDIKDVTEKWVKSMLNTDVIKEEECRYNFNHGVRIGIELVKKSNSR